MGVRNWSCDVFFLTNSSWSTFYRKSARPHEFEITIAGRFQTEYQTGIKLVSNWNQTGIKLERRTNRACGPAGGAASSSSCHTSGGAAVRQKGTNRPDPPVSQKASPGRQYRLWKFRLSCGHLFWWHSSQRSHQGLDLSFCTVMFRGTDADAQTDKLTQTPTKRSRHERVQHKALNTLDRKNQSNCAPSEPSRVGRQAHFTPSSSAHAVRKGALFSCESSVPHRQPEGQPGQGGVPHARRDDIVTDDVAAPLSFGPSRSSSVGLLTSCEQRPSRASRAKQGERGQRQQHEQFFKSGGRWES